MYYSSNQQPPNQPPPANRQNRYPAQGMQSPGVYPGGGQRPRKRRRRSFGWQMLKFLLVLLLVAAVGGGIFVGKTYLDVAPYTNVFLDGVTVDGIDLGGMTWAQGDAAVREQIVTKLSSWYIRLIDTNGRTGTITAETLGISRDPSAALEAAWAVGHAADNDGKLSIFDLQNEIITAGSGTYQFSSVEYNADTTVIDVILSKLESAAYVAPQDAKMLEFNPDSTTEPFTFQEEVIGSWLDVAKLKEEILTMIDTFESGDVLMAPEALYPSLTVEDLQNTYALRGRAVTPIDSSSTEARNENIKNAFSKINGQIINDGAKFSFNGVVGRRTLENGFFRAYEYNYGDLVLGIGGGVCQASTTVYLAAMKAGMTLIDHTPHSEKVSYTDLGMDATVTDTIGASKDMSFRNSSGGQIFIAAHVITDPANKSRYLCEVRIYGVDLGDISYDLETVIVKTLQPPDEPLRINDVDAKYVVYTDEWKVVSEASVGYVVDTYRVTKQNGAEIGSEKITTSTYNARQGKIYYGVTPR